MFLFALPCFTPTAVPQVLTFVFSTSLPLSFVRFFSASGYSAFCFFLSFSSRFRLTVASSVLVFRFRFFRFPSSLPPSFPCFFSDFLYLAFCWFPFVLPCFAPAAVPQVIPFFFGTLACLSLPFVRFRFSLSLLGLCFFLSFSSWFYLSVVFPNAPLSSRFLAFLFLSCLISHAFLPDSCTRLSVRFLSSFPASLPQLFHRCLPFAFAFGLSPSSSTFFRPFLFRF